MATAFLHGVRIKASLARLSNKSVSENGSYKAADDGVDGYSLVEVNVDTKAPFQAGRQAEYDVFWDNYQQNGNRENYADAFKLFWNDTIFKPKYDMRPTNASCMFLNAGIEDLPSILEKQGVELDFSNCTNMMQAFMQAAVTKIGVVDMSKATNIANCFYSCASLKEIEKIIFTEATKPNNTFFNCKQLEKLTIEGVIGQNGFEVQKSPLNHDSLVSIISALENKNPKPAISGAWKLNEAIVSTGNDVTITIATYENSLPWELYYTTKDNCIEGMNTDGLFMWYENEQWLDESFRYLDFGTEPVELSQEALEWLEVNAVSEGGVMSLGATGYTLTLGTENLAKLSDEEKAIAIMKGWNLA